MITAAMATMATVEAARIMWFVPSHRQYPCRMRAKRGQSREPPGILGRRGGVSGKGCLSSRSTSGLSRSSAASRGRGVSSRGLCLLAYRNLLDVRNGRPVDADSMAEHGIRAQREQAGLVLESVLLDNIVTPRRAAGSSNGVLVRPVG